MKSAAGNIEMVFQLYDAGLFCKCNKTKDTIKENDEGNEDMEKVLVHEPNCEGIIKVRELLGYG